MRYTNIHGIPDILAKELSYSRKRLPNRISVSDLLKTTRQRQLAIRYDDEIEVDVSESLWAFLGTACHLVLEKASSGIDGLSEEKLTVNVDGWDIVGVPDLYFKDGENHKLIDLKTTSVFSYILEGGKAKDEWEKQLNLYEWMLREHGFKTDYMEIWMILRDWQKSKTLTDPDYPKIPFVVVKVPIWSEGQAKAFVAERVKMHREAQGISDDKLELCTPEERWRRPSTWAVMDGAKARAVRVFSTPEDAKGYAEGTKYRVVERPGVDNKCMGYCSAAPWCSYFQSLQNERQEAVV